MIGLVGIGQYFVVPFALSGGTGNPDESLAFYSMHFYQQTFRFYRGGYGSALAWTMFIRESSRFPISVGLYQFLGLYDSNIPLVLSGAVIAMGIPLIVFVALQKAFLRGIDLSGSVK